MFTFRPAARTETKPIIGFYGESGCGKTFSSLLLARGYAGEGRVGMIDTESGRGQLYSDVIPRGYDVMTLGEPFSSERYVEAIRAAEQAGLAALVIDSFSHEWEGVGGVLDMATQNESHTGKAGLHNWKDPKLKHQRLVLKLLQSPLFIVVCLRAKHKSRQIKNARTGKAEIIKDDHTTPIQADDFIFELTSHCEIMRDHTLRVTKLSHPSLADVFQTGQRVDLNAGRRLAAWARGGGRQEAGGSSSSRPPEDGAEAGRLVSAPDLDAIRREAEEAAEYGRDRLTAVWRRMDPTARAALGEDFKRLGERADAVDKESHDQT